MTDRFYEGFPDRIEGFSFETLEKDPHSIFALSKDMSLIYFNPAWCKFARDNGGEPSISERFGLGTNFANVLNEEIRDYYLGGLIYSLRTKNEWHHDYECSSPSLYRSYHQTAFPFPDGSGLLLVNSLVEEQAHDPATRPPCTPESRNYIDEETGLITQCVNCRRTQRKPETGEWDWVPEWVERIPRQVSSGLCPLCYEYFWVNSE